MPRPPAGRTAEHNGVLPTPAGVHQRFPQSATVGGDAGRVGLLADVPPAATVAEEGGGLAGFVLAGV